MHSIAASLINYSLTFNLLLHFIIYKFCSGISIILSNSTIIENNIILLIISWINCVIFKWFSFFIYDIKLMFNLIQILFIIVCIINLTFNLKGTWFYL